MRTDRLTAQEARVALSKQDLLILANTLNLVCQGIDVSDFDDVIGADREAALALWQDLVDTFDAVDAKGTGDAP